MSSRRPHRQITGGAFLLALSASLVSAQPDAATIVAKSVQANNADWEAAPHYDFTEVDRTAKGTVKHRVMMIDGSQYYADPGSNVEDEIARRKEESPEQRAKRVAKYESGAARDAQAWIQGAHQGDGGAYGNARHDVGRHSDVPVGSGRSACHTRGGRHWVRGAG